MSKAKAPRVFVPLTKVDEEQRLVYGTITQEMLDKSGEVMDYDTSKPFFEKWSNDIETASGGLSKGNVRVMHGLNACGKLTDLNFDDEGKSIDVCAKIVDDGEWTKVVEGVYTGFSVGGKYEKKWTETDESGAKVKKFTANPNEVSIVDNPCVPSACFTMVKADGAETEVEFQVEHDEEEWPGFTKSVEAPKKADAKKSTKKKTDDKEDEKKAEKAAAPVPPSIPNDVLVKRAEELAEAAGDAGNWQDHLDAAREELTKEAPNGEAQKETEEGGDAKDGELKEGGKADEGADDSATDDEASDADDAAQKVTPAGVKQKWEASDGKTFDKKDDCVAYEETLQKGEPSEAEKLRERLSKALNPEEETGLTVWEDFERLSKVVDVLETPHEDGKPILQKGMYTTSSFGRVLWDMSTIVRKVYKQDNADKKEGEEEVETEMVKSMKEAISTFADCFKQYASDQVDELLANLDDGYCVDYYDYYYAAAQENGDDQLAKDVCTVLQERKDASREKREELAKALGYVGGELEVQEIDEDDLPPNLQKRFDALEEERNEFKKLATDAIEKIEALTKSVEDLGNKPEPRAPRNAHVPHQGDGLFKGASTEEEKTAMLHDMIKTKGPDALALELIKSAQSNGQVLTLNQK